MDLSHIKQYLKRHLRHAGTDHAVFFDEALEVVCRFSGGSAPLINKGCTRSLIFGCQNGKRIINVPKVDLVMEGWLSQE